MACNTAQEGAAQHSILNSTFPVLLPRDEALFLPDVGFKTLMRQELLKFQQPNLIELEDELVSIESNDSDTLPGTEAKAPFISGLEKHAAHHRTPVSLAAENKTLTANSDVTNVSSKNPVVDLFSDLGDTIHPSKVADALNEAWKADPSLTLKIIFNTRSIHLGKSSRLGAYRALGWLAQNHPLSLLHNLQWLVRPIIAKKSGKAGESGKEDNADEDFDMIDAEDADPAKSEDVKYGVSHGYWKDLLNLVVFAANDELKSDGNFKSLLTQKPDKSIQALLDRTWDPAAAKEARHKWRKEQNERVQNKLKSDPVYRALHITVARLFAERLKEDKALLDSGIKSNLKKLSLAAKWAPTFGEFHDKHTFILSTIAEIMFPDAAASCPDAQNRELYLRYIRERYRKEIASPLRKALNVVERDIAAKTFENIKYERVPSLAMNRYTDLFIKKDFEHFKGYLQDVAKGDAQISGATLLPSTLISKARAIRAVNEHRPTQNKTVENLKGEVIDGQWKTLLQRVRDAGSLQSSLAVCDVSGSMCFDTFADGSCPMDSAIGLSILIAEVTAKPFGGGFISFSQSPEYLSIHGGQSSKSLVEQVRYISETHWGGNTNFVAVFEDIILPMAVSNKLKQEDMVKQIFVFSDMQFDQAQGPSDRWTSSYDRIKKKYADAGYEMPRLIFWNLAAKKIDKPVTMDDVDTALVSGYSHGMLRALLETGAFDDEEEVVEEPAVAEKVPVPVDEDDAEFAKVNKMRRKFDPLRMVEKAVSHEAYAMLEVVD